MFRVLSCLCSHVEYSYSNPWAKLIDFDWSVPFPNDVCVIGSLLNQMLFVASMNVNSDAAITE